MKCWELGKYRKKEKVCKKYRVKQKPFYEILSHLVCSKIFSLNILIFTISISNQTKSLNWYRSYGCLTHYWKALYSMQQIGATAIITVFLIIQTRKLVKWQMFWTIFVSNSRNWDVINFLRHLEDWKSAFTKNLQ